jgi:predicted phosphodiesterase
LKYGIISDIHANLEAFQTVLAEIDRVGVDRLICLGDVVGYNANPNECCEIIREREIPTVLGNHDAVACGRDDPSGFNSVALEAALWTRQALNDENLAWLQSLPGMVDCDSFVAVHGAPNDRNTYLFEWEDMLPYIPFLEEHDCHLCMIGHTHSPAIFSTDGAYTVDDDSKFELGKGGKSFFINPGSVGQPRDTNPQAAFGYLDTDAMVFEQVRISYPIEKAQKKILEIGLPQFLAERLALGR